MIYFALREAALGGLEEIFIIINEKKADLMDYLLSGVFREDLEGEGIKGVPRVNLIEQPSPFGSGDAIYRAKEGVGNEAFALLMPDFLLVGAPPPLSQMKGAFERFGRETVGVILLEKGEEDSYGNVGILEVTPLGDDILKVKEMSGKRDAPLRLSGGRAYKAVGRWILFPSFFSLLEEMRGEGGEWDDTPAMRRLCQEGRVVGKILQGKGFDLGNRGGYEAAREWLKGASLFSP